MSKRVVRAKVKVSELISALNKGGVILPIEEGYVVLAKTAAEIGARLGSPFRLIDGREADHLNDRLAQSLLERGTVVILSNGNGYALNRDGLVKNLMKEMPELWFGLPEPGQEIELFASELGDWVKLVVTDGKNKLGPSVVDLRTEPFTVQRKGEPGIMALESIIGSLVRLAPGVIFSVTMVCTGNSCRSPLAAALLNRAVSGLPVLVNSAGIAAPVGATPPNFAILTAKELGLDLTTHRARQLDSSMVEWADLILVMETGQKRWLLSHMPGATFKVKLLGGYPDDEFDIPDPIGRSIELYRHTAALIQESVDTVAQTIRARYV